MSAPHVLIVGGGFAGLNTARGLARDARRGDVRITLVDPSAYMTYKPLLPEVAGGETHPRDVAVLLHRALPHATVLPGRMEAVDSDGRIATVRRLDGTKTEVHYDHVVLALGAVTRVIPVPGIAEQGIGFSTLEEALHLRNHVLDRVRFAASATDAKARTRALTFVFVGGGYTGVEAIAELQDLAAHAIASHPALAGVSPRWVLVEAAGKVAAELGDELAQWSQERLRGRGIDIRLHTTMTSCEGGEVELDDGSHLPADTIVWAAGETPNPALDGTDLPRGPKGHVVVDGFLRVVREDGAVVPGAWALGDDAQVPDPTASDQPAYYPPNAQNAVREGRLLARSIRSVVAGGEPFEYRHSSLGTMADYGPHRGAAVVKGVPLRGLPAWLVDRLYHGIAMPTAERKIRLFAGWAVNALVPRDLVSTSAIAHPRRPFRGAAEAALEKKRQSSDTSG